MPTYVAGLSGGNNYPGADLRLDLTDHADGTAAGNTSTLTYHLYLRRGGTGGQSTYSSSAHPYGLKINNVDLGGSSSYDFRGSSGRGSVGATQTLRYGSMSIAHNPDGTKTVGFTFSFTDQSSSKLLGSGSGSGSLTLARINRDAWDRYTGSAWANAFLERWNGSTWVQQVLERWNGSAWVRQN